MLNNFQFKIKKKVRRAISLRMWLEGIPNERASDLKNLIIVKFVLKRELKVFQISF